MTVHRLPGLRTSPLLPYLATLGLTRCVAEQADPDVRLWWSGEVATIESSVTDLADWLTTHYRPTPILSPWNEGSGFGAKDKTPKAVLDRLLSSADPRLASFHSTYQLAAEVGARARDEKWDKGRIIREFRNRCPDDLVPWLDASVVLVSEGKPQYPPMLGTGGNDGRLDFSTNFHQRLVDVLMPGPTGQVRVRSWAADLLENTADVRLLPAPVGQFDPAGSGGRNSSQFGSAQGLVNPWAYILMLEGSLLFAAGVGRRLSTERGRVAMPFTVAFSPDGGGAGSASEQSRGEVWAPTWQEPLSWPEISQLFREARASWRGKTPQRAVQMYESARTLGVARGIDAFVRHGLHQRNGLAFVATPIETVWVEHDSDIELAETFEDWLDRASRVTHSHATAVAVRAANAAHLAFAREGGSERLTEFLASLTRIEQAVGRSRQATEKLPPAPRARVAASVTRVLERHAAYPAELRIAIALASARVGTKTITGAVDAAIYLRHLLLPVEPANRWGEDWARPRVSGFGTRALVDCLADALVGRMQLASADHGVLGARAVQNAGVRAPWPNVHAWLRGELSDVQIQRYLLAAFRLQYREREQEPASRTAGSPRNGVPDPGLAILQAFASGLRVGQTADLRPAGAASTVEDRDLEGHKSTDPTIGLRQDWPARLRSGQVAAVVAEAAQRLRQYGWEATPPIDVQISGTRYAAATLVPVAGTRRLLASLSEPPTADRQDATSDYSPVEVLT